MPIYETHCKACDKTEPRKVSFREYDQIQAGALTLECECGKGSLDLVFDPAAVSFVLKDGESGGWVCKATKENKHRAARREVMGRRQRDHVNPNKLIPNYQGQVAGSWEEAKDAAYQSTYQKVKREHGERDAAKAATQAAKTFDKHIKREHT